MPGFDIVNFPCFNSEVVNSTRERLFLNQMKFVCKITWEEKKLNVWYLKVHSKVSDNFYVLRSFKNYENAFYFTLKALFVLKIFKFLSWLFGHVEKMARLER